eukprot:TRINITY_DN2203_c0_g1_i3.p2 TRINITY_DN2203_c0_g1~~TRINITY_DN2203_c0_g1_i3.p2  ORF type:complete len:118 (-),score=30.72 TRINITY_DN2203_c0_g1_i3:320-673(-)
MDESPICPLGKRLLRVVGPVGEDADIDDPTIAAADTKRLASAIITIINTTDKQPEPIVLLKKDRLPSQGEIDKCKGVQVAACESGVVGSDFFINVYIPYLRAAVPEDATVLLILDSA